MSDLYPMLINPRFDERIWGGHKLVTELGKAAPPNAPVGESWEVFEENTVLNGAYAGWKIEDLRQTLGAELTGHVLPDEIFPLLTKFIDAEQVLSVQVHPDDQYALQLEGQPNGKTECWYVVEATDGAELIVGFSQDTSEQDYRERVIQGTLQDILQSLPVRAGDAVYIPARTVHAIGPGIVLYELQQTSDITYRIYDWNRVDASGAARELHVDKAARVLDYRKSSRGMLKTLYDAETHRRMVVAGAHFCLEIVPTNVSGSISTHDSPVLICALGDQLLLQCGPQENSVTLPAYSSALIPAAAGTFSIAAAVGAEARALVAYVPPSEQDTRAELGSRGFSDDEIGSFLAQFDPVPSTPATGGAGAHSSSAPDATAHSAVAPAPDEERATTQLFTRSDLNPILTPGSHWWKLRAVFNPGAVLHNGRIALVYRAVGCDGISRLGLAWSSDGERFDDLSETPWYEGALDDPYARLGVEDPRITSLENQYFLTYCKVSVDSMETPPLHWEIAPFRIRSGVGVTEDFASLQEVGQVAGQLNTKDAVLFPERINGRYAVLVREYPVILYSTSVDLIHWSHPELVMAPIPGGWEAERIGAGPPPLRTPWGWMLLYHANEYFSTLDNRRCYRMGLAVLDERDPWNVLYRHPSPIFSPEMPYEMEGMVGNVVFGTGLVELNDRYYMYYGAADGVIGVATAERSAVFALLRRALGEPGIIDR